MPQPHITDMKELQTVFDRYCAWGGYDIDDVQRDQDDALTVFCAVAIRLTDPLYFEFNEYLNHGFIKTLSQITGVPGYSLKYRLGKLRGFMQHYPDFQNIVEEHFQRITHNKN
jgi:hypothetical protein